MQSAYRDIIKHSAIYGLGQILTRVASFLLLPIYTSYLTPADYGIIAILDLVAGMLGILIGAGMGSAVNRFHFEANTDLERSQVWWTGFSFAVGVGVILVFPVFLAREFVAQTVFGDSVQEGGYFLGLVLATTWLNIQSSFLDDYLRIRKWSSLSVSLNFIRLLLNLALNISLLAVWEWGISGILVGNLVANGIATVVLFYIFNRNVGRFQFKTQTLSQLLKYGGPLILTGVISFLTHQGDRYLINIFMDLNEVGIYSLANTIGQAINTLWLLPFGMIWSVVALEIATQKNSKEIFVIVFQYFMYGLALLVLGVSLFAKPILAIVANEEYMSAAELIPIISLAYLFFSMHVHFRVPVLLSKRTSTLIPAFVCALIVNFSGNYFLIPIYGAMGAAWVSVLSFFVYSFVGLYQYRKIDQYDYPFMKCGLILMGMIVTYGMFVQVAQQYGETILVYGMGVCLWMIWAFILFGPILKTIFNEGGILGMKIPMLVPQSISSKS